MSMRTNAGQNSFVIAIAERRSSRFADHFKIVFDFQQLSKFPTHPLVVIRQRMVICFIESVWA